MNYPPNRKDNWRITAKCDIQYVYATYEDAVEYSKILRLSEPTIEPIIIKSINKVNLAQLKRIKNEH